MFFLLAAVVLSIVGGIVVVLRNRQPSTFGTSIDDFSQRMAALAPEQPPGSGDSTDGSATGSTGDSTGDTDEAV